MHTAGNYDQKDQEKIAECCVFVNGTKILDRTPCEFF